MFTWMVFNVVAYNRDDNAKNHAFLLSPERAWAPTPAYDITLSDGPGGEHNLSINGEGRKPSTRDIMLVAEKSSIPKAEAATIVDTVRAAVSDWLTYASQAGISDRRANEIDRLLRQSD
jgi:serine/threonine-protein kinase HipA